MSDNAIVVDQEGITEDEYLEITKKSRGATQWCYGVVAANPSPTANTCLRGECDWLVGTKIYYECDGGACPVQTGVKTTVMCKCNNSGTSMLSGCDVYFSSVSACS